MKTYIKPESQIIKLHTERIIAESVLISDDTHGNTWTRRRMWDEEEEEQ